MREHCLGTTNSELGFVLIHLVDVEIVRTTKVTGIHPLCSLRVNAKGHSNPSNICQAILPWIKVTDQQLFLWLQLKKLILADINVELSRGKWACPGVWQQNADAASTLPEIKQRVGPTAPLQPQPNITKTKW